MVCPTEEKSDRLKYKGVFNAREWICIFENLIFELELQIKENKLPVENFSFIKKTDAHPQTRNNKLASVKCSGARWGFHAICGHILASCNS